MKRFLVTGANGFVGRHLCMTLKENEFNVSAVVRHPSLPIVANECILVEDINSQINWSSILVEIDTVIHLAARVHVLDEQAQDPLEKFLEVNLHGTLNLAKQAVVAGVRRFVFVSSIGVNGAFTCTNNKFKEDSLSYPQNAYAVSKWEAEQALHRLAHETGLEVVILRPPLVYGANAPGNFAQMLRAVLHHFPLPLSSIHNQRDFIYVGNLVDALITCATNPTAAGKTYLVRDGECISTPDLIRHLAKALGKRCFVFPFPIFIMKLLAKLLGKSAAVDRLTQSLQIDDSKIRRELGWKPPFTLQQGLQATADGYLQQCYKK